MRVSVVIDNYNYARFLGDALDSALAQTWGDVEVILVDDGSTDESAAVADRYGDRIHAVFKPNGGQASAFNAGFARSTGDIVIFVDSDDVMHPDYAARAVAALASAPESGMVQFRMRTVDAELRPLGHTVPPEYVELAAGDVRQRVREWTAGSSFAPNGAAAFRRSTLEQTFPLPEQELRQGADFFMLRGAALLAPVSAVDEAAVDYRSHGSNDSNLDELDLVGVRRALHRQMLYASALRSLNDRIGGAPILDPLQALDPLFLTQRLVSTRLEPAAHPFPHDGRLRLMVAGIRAVSRRHDIGALGRLMHAVWFVAVALGPVGLAHLLATRLMLPLSRNSAHAPKRGFTRLVALLQRSGASSARRR